MKNQQSVIAFMNAYTSGKSGADIAFIEIFKRLKYKKLTIVTSSLGQELCEKKGLTANYYITSHEKELTHLIFIYFFRIIKALLLCLTLPVKEIIYVTSDSLPDVLPSFIFKFKNGKAIWIQKIFHLIPKERKISYLAQKISFFFIKRFADKIILSNEFLMDDLVKIGFPKDKIHLNHLGIDLNYLSSIKPSNTKYDAIFMSRLHESKGIFDLIQIWQNVVKKIPDTTLAIIGSGNKTITEQITTYTSEVSRNIKLLGYLEDDEAFSLIKSSKVFLFPSHEEGFGLVIGEVMACKVPVVVYDLPVYQHTFKSGLISVPLGNIDLFSEKVCQILINENVVKETTKKAYVLSKRFTWSLTVKKELQLIKNR